MLGVFTNALISLSEYLWSFMNFPTSTHLNIGMYAMPGD